MKKFATAAGIPPVLHRNTANLMQSMLDEVKANITVLLELKSFIPSLQASEYDQLEANIQKDGCRESLLIWQTTQGIVDGSSNDSPLNILVDGHNRYAICQKNNIDFKIMLREFSSLQAVRDFMIDNQLGRRNLTPEQTSYLRGLKYRNERQATGRPVVDGDSSAREEGEHSLAQRTQDRLAKEFNVSPRTIHRDREYSEGIDKLSPSLKQDVLKGKQKVSKEVIRAIGKNNEANTPPLTLPELLALNEVPLPAKIKQQTQNYRELQDVVDKIVKLAAELSLNSPKFAIACDKIIALSNEAKRLKSA
ncbi:hypothetical protein [Spirosoma utsteinense]|uniref:ParB/Sulfiredoxin domain-containing protein n=1 Tax=Spirosoma utsteinense TaxID=2585773 RepID=A0ABR6WDK7_9BACT|nr:hypothetical protein [Spirosoma utsteinense]MBC3788940.1 hypothetical protein [Spirosoma utsteinense]MBC3794643.1 hypothetical protein [Spirosoma utsteinense]